MKYLKIRAKNYNEAMMKLKMQHGDDAIPISHKYVKEGGIMNSRFFAKDVVELTAAVQEKKYPSRSSGMKRSVDYTVDDTVKKNISDDTPPAHSKKGGAGNNVNFDSMNKSIESINDNLNAFRNGNKAQAGHPAAQTRIEAQSENIIDAGDNDKSPGSSIKNFEREFEEIKTALNKLIKGNDPDLERSAAPSHDENVFNPFLKILKSNDYDSEQCRVLLREVKNSISKDDLKDKFKIEKSLKDLLKSKIITTGPLKIGNKKKIMMFIGPTGVGKTTTMAKLGAIHSLREGHKVAFITIDNYRIAATEQLKKYAEIMRIPVYAVNDQKEFKEVLAREKAEIIMVDTSGRSHRNELKISEIKSFADLVEYDFEKILCVSANTKKEDLDDVFRAFDVMNFDSIVITKVDETSYVGNVVDIADKYNKPISYCTNGQEVPNDIIVADADKIVDMMFGNINN